MGIAMPGLLSCGFERTAGTNDNSELCAYQNVDYRLFSALEGTITQTMNERLRQSTLEMSVTSNIRTIGLNLKLRFLLCVPEVR